MQTNTFGMQKPVNLFFCIGWLDVTGRRESRQHRYNSSSPCCCGRWKRETFVFVELVLSCVVNLGRLVGEYTTLFPCRRSRGFVWFWFLLHNRPSARGLSRFQVGLSFFTVTIAPISKFHDILCVTQARNLANIEPTATATKAIPEPSILTI